MAVQLKIPSGPEFDDNDCCLVCGEKGTYIPALGLYCQPCGEAEDPTTRIRKYIDTDATKLSNNWEDFSKIVHIKLLKHYHGGRTGWDNPSWTSEDIQKVLYEHIDKGDPIDIAALAMFWWYKKGSGNNV